MSPAPDVAIVGGGIVGATLALELAGRGLRVVLHERAAVAAGASGRNSGVVWHPTDPVLEALYLETLRRYRALPALVAGHVPAGDPAHGFRLRDTNWPNSSVALRTSRMRSSVIWISSAHSNVSEC